MGLAGAGAADEDDIGDGSGLERELHGAQHGLFVALPLPGAGERGYAVAKAAVPQRHQIVEQLVPVAPLLAPARRLPRKPRGQRVAVRVELARALALGVRRLQREQLLPGPRADRDAVGDRVAEQVVERAAFAIIGEPGVLRVALDQALLLQRATEALRDVFDGDLKVLWAGLRHSAEQRLPSLVDRVHPVEKQSVEVDVQVRRRAEALDQRLGAGVANAAGKSGTLQQVARDRAIPHAQHPRQRSGVRGQQEPQRMGQRQHPLPQRSIRQHLRCTRGRIRASCN